jgi:uncharacterized protein DUF4372
VFKSWDHLVALVFAQLGRVDGLRALEAIWNANSHWHYHLRVGKLARSTLSDANARRPIAIFAKTFERLSGPAHRTLKREGAEMLRLIDATPIRSISSPSGPTGTGAPAVSSSTWSTIRLRTIRGASPSRHPR